MECEGIDLVVLAGGQANRMGALCQGLPKALLPIRNIPFLAYQLAEIKRLCPIRQVILCVRKDTAQAFANTGLATNILEDSTPWDTGGTILRAADLENLSDPFLAANGDVLFRMDGAQLAIAAHQKGAAMSVVRISDSARFGSLDLHEGMVRGFREKSGLHEPNWINAGLYAFTKASLRKFPRQKCSFEYEMAPVFAKRGHLAALLNPGPFIDIGTPEDYARADDFIVAHNFSIQGQIFERTA